MSTVDTRQRRPVVYRGERIPGLFERTTSDGRTVWELRRKVDGRSIRRALEAQTVSDAIREARQTVAKLDNGVRLVGRSDVSLAHLRDDFAEWANSPASTLAARTAPVPGSHRPPRAPAAWPRDESCRRHGSEPPRDDP